MPSRTSSQSLGDALQVGHCVAPGRLVPPSGPLFPRWFSSPLLVLWLGNTKASSPPRRLQSRSRGLWRWVLGAELRRRVQPSLEDLDSRLKGWLLCFRNKKLESLERTDWSRVEWTGSG